MGHYGTIIKPRYIFVPVVKYKNKYTEEIKLELLNWPFSYSYSYSYVRQSTIKNETLKFLNKLKPAHNVVICHKSYIGLV